MTQIQHLHQASRRSDGSRRLSQALQQAGHAIGRYRTRTLMRQGEPEAQAHMAVPADHG